MSEQFLTIDVSSELTTLCEAQLRGTWQVPAELVRLALRLGAGRVLVRRRFRRFEISWQGTVVPDTVFADLHSSLAVEIDTADRQHAIASLERSGMEGLLWAAGLRGAKMSISCTNGGRSRWFRVTNGRPRIGAGPSLDHAAGVKIQWRCAGLDGRRASRWLAIATRYAPVPVVFDGREMPAGFAGGLFHLQLEEPVPCRLGLTRVGDDPMLWLLRDGIVSARASIPGYPPFAAAVELGGVTPPGASAADLRRAVAPFLPELVDRAVWMMVQVLDRMQDAHPGDRERLRLLLLRAAAKGFRTSEICRLPLLATAADENARLSVEDARQLAERRGGVSEAVASAEDGAADIVDPQTTIVASTEVRHLLAEIVGMRFQPPTRRLETRRRRFVQRARSISQGLRRRARGLREGREVPRDRMTPSEARLVAEIRRVIAPIAVSLREGSGGAGRVGDRVILRRSSPSIQAAADRLESNPSWAYVALLALDVGIDPPESLRERWWSTLESSKPGI